MTSSKPLHFISVALAIVAPVVIIIYTLEFFRTSLLSNYITAFAAIMLLAFFISLFFKNRFCSFLKSLILLFGITYLLLELTTYFLLSFGIIRPDMRFFFKGFEATDRKVVVYDSISGYRAIPGEFRYLSINNGLAEIDHIATVNNSGWFSNRAYFFKKQKQRTKRYLVLGDSFSSGMAVSTPWCDLVQSILLKNGNDSIELYNFSLDGAGIQNWYRTFLYDIIPKYDFDGIIIAASSEKNGIPDFDRKFIMANSGNNTNYMQLMDITNHSLPVNFPLQNAVPASLVLSSSKMDQIKSNYASKHHSVSDLEFKKPDLWFLAIFYGVTDGVYKMLRFIKNDKAYTKPYETYYQLSGKPYKMEYFDNRYKYGFMLKEIISYCKNHQKQIVLLTIPDCENARDYVKGQEIIYRKEHQFLSNYYGLKYYDGFDMFKGKDENFVNQYFYKYDLHWNQAGAELFAKKVIESGVLN